MDLPSHSFPIVISIHDGGRPAEPTHIQGFQAARRRSVAAHGRRCFQHPLRRVHHHRRQVHPRRRHAHHLPALQRRHT